MKTTKSICPKSWEQTRSLERRVGSSSQAESVRTWLSLSQEEGGSFKIRTAGLKVCTCSQRGKKARDPHWGDGKKSCAIFGMENKSGLAGNNVASLWRTKPRPCPETQSYHDLPSMCLGSQDPERSLAH